MKLEPQTEGSRTSSTLIGSAVGYGIVCGLTFPLMISSTFLKEMSLSHGAGDAFGALFFIAYALTMAGTALAYAIRRKPSHRMRMISAFGAAFLGNTLMLARLIGFIEGGWAYAVAASCLIGYGLATAELGWMACITALHERSPRKLVQRIVRRSDQATAPTDTLTRSALHVFVARCNFFATVMDFGAVFRTIPASRKRNPRSRFESFGRNPSRSQKSCRAA